MSPITWAVVLLAGFACVTGQVRQTDISSVPSLVQVEDRVGASWFQQCLGSVLTSSHILTAANCFINAATNTRRIRAGTSYRAQDGIVMEVSDMLIHESYGTLGNDGDIAVVRLLLALPLGPNIAQVAILGEGIDLPTNLRLNLASWGTTTEGGIIGDRNLYTRDLFVVDTDRCLETYLLGENTGTVTENMLCAGETYLSGRDLDSRDLGAPLFYDNVAVGVLSWGVSRGNDEFPVVAAAISSYTSWIVNAAIIL